MTQVAAADVAAPPTEQLTRDARAETRSSGALLTYACPLFLGAFLLFQVQPIIGRCILPWFGGTPSVWTTCMLFFQVLLVGGYLYAHLVAARARPRAQAAIHIGLLAVSLGALVLMVVAWGSPLLPGASLKPMDPGAPVLRIMVVLLLSVGLPYFVLATTSPLLQAWFNLTAPGVSPYRLYAVSNAGSLLGLLTYPFLIEPTLGQKQQAWVWAAAYALFCVGCAGRAWRVWRTRAEAPLDQTAEGTGDEAEPRRADRYLWVALPALASALLLATTNHICQDVAVTPFLWVLPLSLYLLSFIVCFEHTRWYWRPMFVPLTLLACAVGLVVLPNAAHVAIPRQVLLYCMALFLCAMVCHGEVAALKPSPRRLTSFYLSIAVGGALGGLLVAVVAPVVFRGYTELPIALFLGAIVAVVMPGLRPLRAPRLVAYGRFAWIAVMVAAAVYTYVHAPRDNVLGPWRNFYGTLRVEYRIIGKSHVPTFLLLHGQTVHGAQLVPEELKRVPTAYYTAHSGVGMALRLHPRRSTGPTNDRGLRIGVCGLGVGTLAALTERGDYLKLYEINPQVVEIARDTGLFTYLKDCPAQTEIVLGDARVSLERELRAGEPQQFDVLVLDAFSGDAIPAHLLTKEALSLYLQHLRPPDGIVAIHITNGVLDLAPVVWGVAKELGLDTALLPGAKGDRYSFDSNWMVLSPTRNYLRDAKEAADAQWADDGHRSVRLWTDDYYNLLQLLK